MRKAAKVLLLILAVLALSAVVYWIGGPEAGGTALLMISIGVGAYFAVGWGGDYATKVESYRPELILKKRPSDSKPDLGVTDRTGEDRGPTT
ncbi:hypothetical protein [Arthrobacter sp. B10-11]|uniref:hypothetical protein n=1 Tax=Arthrobacter sp. B10-11 TaxID=3081160 RepID=UPI002953EABD|nr:hypothetical protein [Arthrobacter sp. B10-11]MDV8148432.1 hypothetical protein [Arthrobacter sp. B10-11]